MTLFNNINKKNRNYLRLSHRYSTLYLEINKVFNRSITIKPIIKYEDCLSSKHNVLLHNKDKCGIYRWVNIINNKSYIGSSISLSNRISNYYYISSIKRRLGISKSLIYSALLKYGHNNFRLEIIEYCKPDFLIKREQFYIDSLKPEYNILKTAGSTLGFRFNHSEATKLKLSISKRGKKHNPSFSLNLSKARRGCINNKPVLKFNNIPKIITNDSRKLMSLRSRGVSVKVFDKKNNFIKEFRTISDTALYFGVHPKTISNILKTGKSYDDYIYKFEIKDIKIRVYNSKKELINKLDNLKKTSMFYNIPPTTLFRYVQSGKLYKNTYIFVSGKDS